VKTHKNINTRRESILSEPLISYQILDDSRSFILINKLRECINIQSIHHIKQFIKLTLAEWFNVLHISERTINRYEKENKNFAPNYSQ
jgi:hypothetical protein